MSKRVLTKTKSKAGSITAQEAVAAAVQNFSQVNPKAGKDLRLEEVFLDENEENWFTTLSFPNPDYESEHVEDTPSSRALQMLGREWATRRIAKRIKLRASDGKFIGILNA